jgi:hypothetical protein
MNVCPTADTTRFARVTFIYFHNRNSLILRLVCENLGEAVERLPMQIEISVPTPVLRRAVLVFLRTPSKSPMLICPTPFLTHR